MIRKQHWKTCWSCPSLKPSPCDSWTIPGHVGLLLSPVDGSRNGLRVAPGKQLGPVRARIPWQSLQSRRQLHEHLPEHKPPTPICELFGLYNIHVVCALCKRRQCLCSDLNWKSLPTFSLCKLHSQSLRATPLVAHSTKTAKDQPGKFITPFKATNLDRAHLLFSCACKFKLIFFQDCNLEGSPRHSLGSNNSSNLSTPPSPVREVGSSSYESWVVKRSFMLLLKPTYREEKSSERKTKKSEGVRLLEICAVAVGLWGFHSQIQFYLNFTARFNWISIHQILHSFSQPVYYY